MDSGLRRNDERVLPRIESQRAPVNDAHQVSKQAAHRRRGWPARIFQTRRLAQTKALMNRCPAAVAIPGANGLRCHM
jgi:hypothetical protein